MPANDAYRRSARYYDRIVEPLNAGVRDVVARVDPPQPEWAVLDVGCGTGTGLARYQAAGCEIHGVDLSPAMLARARARLGDDADLRLVDGPLPFADGRFDRVTASMMIHEVPAGERAALLGEMRRVTAAGGRIVVVDFRFGSLRGAKGPAIRALTWLIERVGGHYRGYRSFRRGGGVPPLAARCGLEVQQEKIVAGGNLAVYVLKETDDRPGAV